MEYVNSYGSMEIAKGIYRSFVTVVQQENGRRTATIRMIHETDERQAFSAHKRAEGQYLLFCMRGDMPSAHSGWHVLSEI